MFDDYKFETYIIVYYSKDILNLSPIHLNLFGELLYYSKESFWKLFYPFFSRAIAERCLLIKVALILKEKKH